jgi:predicted transcriptional regulator
MRTEGKKNGKDRLYKIYFLKVGFNKIITQLETERKKQMLRLRK